MLKKQFVRALLNTVKNSMNELDINKIASNYGEFKKRKGLIYISDIELSFKFFIENKKIVIEEIDDEYINEGIKAILKDVNKSTLSLMDKQQKIMAVCDCIEYNNVIVVDDYSVLVDIYKGERTYKYKSRFGDLHDSQEKTVIEYGPEIAVTKGDIATYGKDLVSDASLFFQKMLKETYEDTREKILDRLE